MKTTKRILAVMLAALMLVMAIPFAVAAADGDHVVTNDNKLNLYCSKEGVTFDVYLLATLDTKTGHYFFESEDAVGAGVKSAITNGSDAATIAAAADAEFEGNAKLGTKVTAAPVTTFNKTDLKSGLYYVHYAGQLPEGITALESLLIPAPYFAKEGSETAPSWHQNTAPIDVTNKVATEAKITKAITTGDFKPLHAVEGLNKSVGFELRSTIAGSAAHPLETYVVADQMSKGLTLDQDSIVVKMVKKGADDVTLTKGTDYDFTAPVEKGNVKEFKFNFAKKIAQANTNIYNYSTIVITYNATVNSDAVIGNPGNPNDADLTYKVTGDDEKNPKAPTVYVFTMLLKGIKVDATNTEKKLGGAEFTLTGGSLTAPLTVKTATQADVDADTATPKTVELGTARFERLGPGTYKLVETKNPEGYNLNTTEYTITLSPSVDSNHRLTVEQGADYASQTIENTPSLLPKTGGPGTIAFTVIGASLIVCAGVLLIVVMKKRAK